MPPTAIIDLADRLKRDKNKATARDNDFKFQPLAFELNGGFSKNTRGILKKWSAKHPDRLPLADILHCELARCCADLLKAYEMDVALVHQGLHQRGYCSSTPSPASVVDASPNVPTLNVLPGSV